MIDSFITLPFSVCNEDPTHTSQLLLWKSPSSDQPVFLQVSSEILSIKNYKTSQKPCMRALSTGTAHAALLSALCGIELGWVYASNASHILTTI